MSTAQYDTEPRKRRARYVLRACDACKRRKGRCDGRKPCQHCQYRSIECHYAMHSQLGPDCAGNAPSLGREGGRYEETVSLNLDRVKSLTNIIETLQRQLDELVTEMKAQSGGPDQPGPPSPSQHQSHAFETRASAVPPKESMVLLTFKVDRPKRSTCRFHGSTSSGYSLNMAQMKLCQPQDPDGSLIMGPDHKTIPSLDDEETTDIEVNTYPEDDKPDALCQPRGGPSHASTTQILRLLNKSEAVRLLHVYQEVIGDLHPILDIKCLIEQVEALYTMRELERGSRRGNALRIHEDNIQILTVVLSIALLAETTGQSNVGKTLYHSVQGKIQTKMASRETNLQGVILLLLTARCSILGMYHFFSDEIWLAWRLCSIAGRLAMELGLHRRDIFQYILKTQSQRTEATNVLWSIVVLDRQWSCATGLAQNFQESDFDKCLPAPENAPYLIAMISYASFSPRLWDSLHRATTGGACEDDDSFEFVNFQVEQWREKALAELQFVHPDDRDTLGAVHPPKLVPTLLYLRANQLRGLILRPFFLSNSNVAASKRNAKPGLELACDTIRILSDMNETTDIYSKQHPIFQHFLASSVALLLLIVAHEVQNRSISSSNSWRHFLPAQIGEGITRAFDLAAAYSHSSSASRRLWKRLVSMLEPLSGLGIIPHEGLCDQALCSSSICPPSVDDGSKSNRSPDKFVRNADPIQTAELVSLPESTFLTDFTVDDEFAWDFNVQELSGIRDNNCQIHLPADINAGTLNGPDHYVDDWTWDEMSKLFTCSEL